MSEKPATSAESPSKTPARWRAKLNRAAAGLTHTVFVMVIALAFVRGGEPQATTKDPGRLASLEVPPQPMPAPHRRLIAISPTPPQREGETAPEVHRRIIALPQTSPQGEEEASQPQAASEAHRRVAALPQTPPPREEEAPRPQTPLPPQASPAQEMAPVPPQSHEAVPAPEEAPAASATSAEQTGAGSETPAAAPGSADSGEFELAQRSRRSRREPREEPPAEPAQPLPTPQRSAADQDRANRLMARLVAAYPDFLTGHDDNNLVWRDGTRMGFDDGAEKSFQERLERPDIEDQFAIPYPVGDVLSDPEPDFDPGRFRNAAFFLKMYGDCRRGSEVQKRLVDVVWLPKTGGGRKIKATPVNGVAEKLQRISDELDALPAEFQKFLRPIGSVFTCRDILNTSRSGAHAFGIAIDLNASQGDYWDTRRGRRRGDEAIVYRNRIPPEIVAIFEKHGFIWGGKWYHYDTAHFEYRPELLVADEVPGTADAPVPMPVKQPRNLN